MVRTLHFHCRAAQFQSLIWELKSNKSQNIHTHTHTHTHTIPLSNNKEKCKEKKIYKRKKIFLIYETLSYLLAVHTLWSCDMIQASHVWSLQHSKGVHTSEPSRLFSGLRTWSPDSTSLPNILFNCPYWEPLPAWLTASGSPASLYPLPCVDII